MTSKALAEDETATEFPTLDRWKFENVAPTQEQVLELLATVKPVWGVKAIDYAAFVQALPNNEKRKKQVTRGNKSYEEDYYVPIWTIYMSVAGRQLMLDEAIRKNDWIVEYHPEPVTSTGTAGILFLGDAKVAYRVSIVIHKNMEDGSLQLVGSRTGQSARSGNNNWEKAETAAKGRALGSWGFGIFPGSGIASLEEMQTAETATGPSPSRRRGPNREDEEAYGDDQAPTREELIRDIKMATEQMRLLRHIPASEQQEKNRKYLVESCGYAIEAVWDPNEQVVDYSRVQTAHLTTILRNARQIVAQLEAQEQPL